MKNKPIPDEDIDLFRDAVGDAKPLNHNRAETPPKRPAPVPRQRERDDQAVSHEMLFGDIDPADIETGEELIYHRAGLPLRDFMKLRRGRFVVEAELDLHGLTREMAKVALSDFLKVCQTRRIRCIRVIHGKGHGSPHRRPILKSHVARWLQQWDDVLAYCSARVPDGGTGAVYVLLKKR